MPDEKRSPAPYWSIAALVGSAFVGAGLIAHGFNQDSEIFMAVGFLGLILAATASVLVSAISRGAPAGASGANPMRRELKILADQIERLGELGALSDDARRVLNRSGERDLLRRAINEDIASGDYDAAMVLVKELAERFGYRADAEEFREKIETARFQEVDTNVARMISNLDRMIIQLRWSEAAHEAARITRLFPDSPRVDGLRHRVEHAREKYKTDLERRFLHTAQAEKVDEALEILKELDHYLSEAEAEPLREMARGVIGKARENLGVQFKIAIQDRDWGRALEAAERILAEFPNTRMAEEVRQMVDGLRARAGGGGGRSRERAQG